MGRHFWAGLFLSVTLVGNAASQEAVQWTDARGLSISGGTVTKVAPAGWNASAISRQVFAGSASADFQTAETSSLKAAGLARVSIAGTWEDLDFGIRMNADSTFDIVEGGHVQFSGGLFYAADTFRIETVGSDVSYRRNGALVYQSSQPAPPSLQFLFAANSVGATLVNVTLSGALAEGVVWTSHVDSRSRGNELYKTTFTSANAGAISTRALQAGNGYVETVINLSGLTRVIGLSNGNTDASGPDIDFAFRVVNSALSVVENGVSKGTFGSVTPGDALRVAVTDGVVRYSKNGALLYTSLATPSYPLLVDVSLQGTIVSAVDATLGGAWIDSAPPPPSLSVDTGTYGSALSVVVTGEASDTLTYTLNGVDPTPSDTSVPSGGSIGIASSATLKVRAWRAGGSGQGIATAGYAIGTPTATTVDWTPSPMWSTSGIVSPDGYIEATIGSTAQITWGLTTIGASQILFGFEWLSSHLTLQEQQNVVDVPNAAVGDVLRIAIEGGKVVYRVNGARVFVSRLAPSYPLAARTVLTKVTTMGGVLVPIAVEAVTANPLPGAVSSGQTVSLSTATPGSTIRYTLDGSSPTASSPVYSAPLTITSSTFIKAAAFKTGFVQSAVFNGFYSIGTPTSEAVTWSNPANVLSVAAGALSYWEWSSSDPGGAVSTRALQGGDGFVEGKFSNLDAFLFLGLSNGDTTNTPADLDFGVTLGVAGVSIYESGLLIGTFGTPGSVTDLVRVAVENGAVKYRQNGNLLYTSAKSPTYPLGVDTSLQERGTGISAVSLSGFLVDQGAQGVTMTPSPGSYTSVQVSLATTTPSASIRYTLDGSSPSSGSTLYSAPISISSGGRFLRARAFKSGLLPGMMASGFYAVNAAPASASVVWVNRVNSTLGSPSGSLSYGPGASGLPSGAASDRLIFGGDGYVESKWTTLDGTAYVGLSRGDADQTVADIDFAASLTAAGVAISEGGTQRGVFGGVSTISDVVRITVESGVVRYKKNGTVIYTSQIGPSYPLLVDASLSVAGSNLSAVLLSGTTSSSVLVTPSFSPAGTGSPFTPSASVAISVGYNNPIQSGIETRYTLDGSVPTISSPLYSSSLTFKTTTTLSAKAFHPYYLEGLSRTDTYIITLPAPAVTPATGTYAVAQSVGITCSTCPAGTTLRYTVDGTDPSQSSAPYSAAFVLSSSATVKARAFHASAQSSAATARVITLQAAAPVITPAGGTFTGSQTVTLSTVTAAPYEIRYTTDGSVPTASSALYSSTLTVSAPTTLKATTMKSGWASSAVATVVFTPTVATPTFSVAAGTYAAEQTVALATTTQGATIRYTVDGSTPTSSSTVYSTPITVGTSQTVAAVAFQTGWQASGVGSATYIIQTPMPTITATGQSSGGRLVSVEAVSGAVVFYTLDGSPPTASSSVFSAPLVVPIGGTLKVVALTPGRALSEIAYIRVSGISGLQGLDAGGGGSPGLIPIEQQAGAPVGSYALSDFEAVNLYGGNLLVNLPIATVAGRGDASLKIRLPIQQRYHLNRDEQGGGTTTQPITYVYWPSNNWDRSVDLPDFFLIGRGTPYCAKASADGEVEYFINFSGTCVQLFGGSERYEPQSDNAGYFYDGLGNTYRIEDSRVKWMQDRNGNRLSVERAVGSRTFIDTLGRPTTITNGTPCTAPAGGGATCEVVTTAGFGGVARTVTLYRKPLWVARGETGPSTFSSLFPEIPWAEQGGSASFNPSVVTDVRVPDGRAYHFTYNKFGEVSSIDLPTGGRLEYDWGGGAGASANGVSETGDGFRIDRRVRARRTISEAGVQSVTEYAQQADGGIEVRHKSGGGDTLAIDRHYFSDDPAFFSSTYPNPFFVGDPSPTLPSPPNKGKEIRTDWLDPSSGSLVQRQLQEWDYENHVVRRDTEADGRVFRERAKYDFGGRQTDAWVYDVGNGTAGPLLRRSKFTYNAALANSAPYFSYARVRDSTYAGETDDTLVAQQEWSYDGEDVVDRVGAYASFSPIGARGNVTLSRRRLIGENRDIQSLSTYDSLGNVVSATDPLGQVTRFEYADNFGTPNGAVSDSAGAPIGQATFAFVTHVKDPLDHDTYAQYDYFTGRTVDVSDANGVVTTAQFENGENQLDRLLKIVNANGTAAESRTRFEYDDANRLVKTFRDRDTAGDEVLKTEAQYDALGRPMRAWTHEAGGSKIESRTEYDGLGRVWRVSDPFRGASPSEWTETIYDAVGRVRSVIAPGGAATLTSYSGNETLVTDPAGKARRMFNDGLGRLVKVVEAPGAAQDGPHDVETAYSYDALGNLTSVTQAPQVRSFAYDSLSRLSAVTNPESGTITYAYDDNGNIIKRIDARGVETHYTYDALNRRRTRTYVGDGTGTPTVTYEYDTAGISNSIGRLTAVITNAQSDGDVLRKSDTFYDHFDALGRVLAHRQITDGKIYATSTSYNRAGATKSLVYPSGRTVDYEYDAAGRLAGVSGLTPLGEAETYVRNGTVNYSPHGAVESWTLGNGVVETTDFNARQQAEAISFAKNDNLLSITYQYGPPAQNNGNVVQQAMTLPGSSQPNFVTGYTYDTVNRLVSASENINAWQQTYGYDRFGNRTVSGDSTTYSTSSNRVSGVLYDAAGNQLQLPGGRSGGYDAENRLISVAAGGDSHVYSYDGDDRRVYKHVFGGGDSAFFYSATGQLLGEVSTEEPGLRENVYAGSKLIAVASGAASDGPGSGSGDACDGVVCANGGVCVDGQCVSCSPSTLSFEVNPPPNYLLGDTVTFVADPSSLELGSEPIWLMDQIPMASGLSWTTVLDQPLLHVVTMVATEGACGSIQSVSRNISVRYQGCDEAAQAAGYETGECISIDDGGCAGSGKELVPHSGGTCPSQGGGVLNRQLCCAERPACAAMGGTCVDGQMSACPVGSTLSGLAADCDVCCQPVHDGACAPVVEDCGVDFSDCPCPGGGPDPAKTYCRGVSGGRGVCDYPAGPTCSQLQGTCKAITESCENGASPLNVAGCSGLCCVPEGSMCTSTAQCLPFACVDGACLPCGEGYSCGNGYTCTSNVCVPNSSGACTESAECPNGEVCTGGSCNPCTSSAQCSNGQLCNSQGACVDFIVGDNECSRDHGETCAVSSDCACTGGLSCVGSGATAVCVQPPITCDSLGGVCALTGDTCGQMSEHLEATGCGGGRMCCVANEGTDPCSSPSLHAHSGSCGNEDVCGHVFGSPQDSGCGGAGGSCTSALQCAADEACVNGHCAAPSCGSLVGQDGGACMAPGQQCDADREDLGASAECAKCCGVHGSAQPPEPWCGDGVCNGDEDPSTCYQDCEVLALTGCGIDTSCGSPTRAGRASTSQASDDSGTPRSSSGLVDLADAPPPADPRPRGAELREWAAIPRRAFEFHTEREAA